jgi:hypothetical protein
MTSEICENITPNGGEVSSMQIAFQADYPT